MALFLEYITINIHKINIENDFIFNGEFIQLTQIAVIKFVGHLPVHLSPEKFIPAEKPP